MDTQPETVHELNLLEQIEDDPDVSQATLASQLGVAVGTVNWYLKRLIAKGYVKVKRAERRKLRYNNTPEGIAFRARLTINYIETSMKLYRRTRQHVRELLGEIKQAGFTQVHITGEGDIADICRLTCLEQGISVADMTDSKPDNLPVLEVQGVKVYLSQEKAHEA